MLDFFMVSTRIGRRGIVEIYPRFIIKKSSDLMIRGGDFYAIWDEDNKRWSTDEDDAKRLIDSELDKYYEQNKDTINGSAKVLHMWDAETGMIDVWHKYCQKQLRDSYHMLDEKLIFSNTEVTKKDYASKCLPYPLEYGDTPAYDKLMDTLYAPKEREKIEWAIGSVVSGDSKRIQKFLVLYGAAGTGKSTVLNIIQQLFDGYYSVFDAKSLGSSNNQFALEAFSSNPLVAIQHDGDLSHIEDNTRLNSLVSHEMMVVNEKHKNLYRSSFKSFLFMGTNKPVRITDAKSGIIRRLIDVSPSGDKLAPKEYKTTVAQIAFELGKIATHCLEVYESDPGKYDDYIPLTMLDESNDFYNFVMDNINDFENQDGITLKEAWVLYKKYCDFASVPYPLSQRVFKSELKNYFKNFEDRVYVNGERLRNYYSGFLIDKFEASPENPGTGNLEIVFKEQSSVFDKLMVDCPAQYASAKETPLKAWDGVDTTLKDIDTSKLHYVRVPENHIVIDFDIPDADGNKCFEKNLEAASKWPATYAELSKSGAGIHLHYIYNGDVSKLSRVYDDHIEIKVFNGNSSLRRKLTKCNDLDIATISSGLPLQEEKKKVDGKIKSQKKLFEMIERNLRKEIHDSTKPSCDFIYKIVEDAYNDGVTYEIPDEMKTRIMDFAKGSTHQSKECIRLMKKMHYKSKDIEMRDEMKTNSYKLRKYISHIINDGDMTAKEKFDKINEILLETFNGGEPYDVRDIRGSLLYFASSQPNKEVNRYCLSLLDGMQLTSEAEIVADDKPYIRDNAAIIFYDVEVYPNLFLVCWKLQGEGQPVVRWYNPTPEQMDELMKFRLIGYNCRRYDNHMIYARSMGYSNEKLYKLSQKIINGISRDCFFSDAYNISYTDVYDFASAGNKMSLKKAEIEMGIHHMEMDIPWDQPVPDDKLEIVGDYCCNDVKATEKRFEWLKADWTARQILADIAEMTVNDTTNTLTTRIIFGKNRKPQDAFKYRDLSKPVKTMDDDMMRFLSEACPDMMSYQHGQARSLLPYFPGYKYESGVSTYRGEVVGEGGYVYAEPGMYTNVALLDVASMHPHSAIAECLFGVEYTTAFRDLVEARVYIKHEQWSKVEKMLNGKLKPYVQRVKNGEMTSKDLANALKTAINSVYGLTSAQFENAFRDLRNLDNIVAKRGALFMIDLKHEVQKRGFTVAHIKTDSIKIPDATPEIIQFVMDFGKQYGYTFEHEATYKKMCLVNDAVYIAQYDNGEWTATGTQFAVPYVFKKLFSHEDITFDDVCETKSVSTSLYLDDNEGLEDGEHSYDFVGRVGQFCPVINGVGGGQLMREKDGKYSAATGTKGYRWMQSETLRDKNWKDYIDFSYYNNLVDDAVKSISQYGDFEWFAA